MACRGLVGLDGVGGGARCLNRAGIGIRTGRKGSGWDQHLLLALMMEPRVGDFSRSSPILASTGGLEGLPSGNCTGARHVGGQGDRKLRRQAGRQVGAQAGTRAVSQAESQGNRQISGNEGKQ